MDWLDLLAVQGTLKSLLQHHSINSLALNHLYGPTLISICDNWKNHSFDYMDLCWHYFVSKLISLLFNTLSRFVIAFPFKEQASFNFMAVVTVHSDFVAQENKSVTASTFPLLFTVK